MQLQRTIGNKAVGKLLSEIGIIPSKTNQALVQMQIIPKEEKGKENPNINGNTTFRSKLNTGLEYKGNYVLQMVKDVDVLNLPAELTSDFKTWDGQTPFEYREEGFGVLHFQNEESIRFMDSQVLHEGIFLIRYNRTDMSKLSNSTRYYTILHEMAHIYYRHPGNTETPMSIENEYQADDTTLVTVMTQDPLYAIKAATEFIQLIETQIKEGKLGGGTHPYNVNRLERVKILGNQILDTAYLKVNLKSNMVSGMKLHDYLEKCAVRLQIDKNDLKKSESEDLWYIDGEGQIYLRNFLNWWNTFNQVDKEIPGFFLQPVNCSWQCTPQAVHHSIKDKLPY